jgi:hypothetical protein
MTEPSDSRKTPPNSNDKFDFTPITPSPSRGELSDSNQKIRRASSQVFSSLSSSSLSESRSSSSSQSQDDISIGVDSSSKSTSTDSSYSQSHLITSSDPESIENAFKVLVALDAVQNTSDPTLHLEERRASSETQLKGLLNGFQDTLDALDPKNSDDRELAKEIHKILVKTLSPETGGIGCFEKNAQRKWDPTWNEPSEEFKPLKEMLSYLIDETPRHFDLEQMPINKIDQIIIGKDAVIGICITDLLLNKNLKSREKLEKELTQKNILCHFENGKNFQESVRKSPLLAEQSQSLILPQIQTKLNKTIYGDLKEVINSITLTSSSPEEEISDERLKDLAEKISSKVTYTPKVARSGPRGRATSLPPSLGAALKQDTQSVPGAYSSMPNRELDEHAQQLSLSILEKSNHFLEIDKAKQMQDIVNRHHASPAVVLRLGAALETELHRFLKKPQGYVKQAIDLVLKDTTLSESEKKMLEELKNKYNQYPERLASAIGNLKIEYNANDRSHMMKINELASLPTIASIMTQNKLRVICSISGTTTDIIVALVTEIGLEAVEKELNPLFIHAMNLKKAQEDPKSNIDSISFDPPSDATEELKTDYKKFKRLFAKITYFMQSGQYHTAAEVLGGLCISATAMKGMNAEEVFELFEVLMKHFSRHPEQYFPLDKEMEEKLFVKENITPAVKSLWQEQRKIAKSNIEADRATPFL